MRGEVLHLGFRGRLSQTWAAYRKFCTPYLSDIGVEIVFNEDARRVVNGSSERPPRQTSTRIASLENFFSAPETILAGGELYIISPEKLANALSAFPAGEATVILEIMPATMLYEIVRNHEFRSDANIAFREQPEIFSWADLIDEIIDVCGHDLYVLDGRSVVVSTLKLLSCGQLSAMPGAISVPDVCRAALSADQGTRLAERLRPHIERSSLEEARAEEVDFLMDITLNARRTKSGSQIPDGIADALLQLYDDDLTRLAARSDVTLI